MPSIAPTSSDNTYLARANVDSTENEALELDGQYRKPGGMNHGWMPRLAAMLVGEDPTQCYAVICRNCHVHNGNCHIW